MRVLVVEDNRDGAQSMVTLLRRFGHDARAAFDGPSALAEALREPPEVVLLDIGLPKMNGFEVARRLREIPATNRLLLIAVTGYGTEADRLQSEQAGIDMHLLKPVDLRELAALLKRFECVSR
jgi:two-component system, chemotaxis family, CheB/CheR fusion protein